MDVAPSIFIVDTRDLMNEHIVVCSSHALPAYGLHTSTTREEDKAMGKYVLGWLLGIPVFVLVIIYLFVH